MKRKLIITGIALVGFVLVLVSTSWAGQGRPGHRHWDGGKYHSGCQNPPGNHYGWERGRGNPHQPAWRHHSAWHHQHRHQRPVVVEKHVYHHHHYPKKERRADGYYNIAASLVDQAFGFSVAVSGSH